LNVKAHHTIDNCNAEIKDVLNLIDKYAKDALKYIWRVAVFHANAEVYSPSDLIVYEQEKACP
jgi:hypothetical protein